MGNSHKPLLSLTMNELSCNWSTADLLILVQTIYKFGFIEWNTIVKRLKTNPHFSLKHLTSNTLLEHCENQFNIAFCTFLEKTNFLPTQSTGKDVFVMSRSE